MEKRKAAISFDSMYGRRRSSTTPPPPPLARTSMNTCGSTFARCAQAAASASTAEKPSDT